MPKTTDFLNEFTEALRQQLEEDHERWADTWLERGLVWKGVTQEERFAAWVEDGIAEHFVDGEPLPWLKFAGEALIGWVRENHPEILT